MSASYYASNNQQIGVSYDGNGNQTWDSGYVTHYTWNVENRLGHHPRFRHHYLVQLRRPGATRDEGHQLEPD
jgi:hypothetical protein